YARHFSLSTSTQADKDIKQHATQKTAQGDHHDPQSKAAKEAQHSAKEKGTGGNATEQKDSVGGVKKAKKEFPEAPDPVVGMQDERGGRG
ncbi:hypothetical protein EJ04DRAFT_414288, partial [Polyplosphaeria fusca]